MVEIVITSKLGDYQPSKRFNNVDSTFPKADICKRIRSTLLDHQTVLQITQLESSFSSSLPFLD